jgi:hypothetical protein
VVNPWHRADQGDLPQVGAVISMVVWRAKDSTVVIKERMRVEVVYADPLLIAGPSLPFERDDRVVLPERPDNPEGGTITMWRMR